MATINLSKGSVINLSKASGGKKDFYVGLGWKENPNIDLDASAFPCHHDDQGVAHLIAPANEYLVCYATTLVTPCGGITHSGDNLTGADIAGNNGDDEIIRVFTNKIDPRVAEISIVVTIHEAAAKRQDFGQVEGAYLHICEMNADGSPGAEIANYRLTDDGRGFTALQFGSLMKDASGDWSFHALGQGYAADLGQIINNYAPLAQVSR